MESTIRQILDETLNKNITPKGNVTAKLYSAIIHLPEKEVKEKYIPIVEDRSKDLLVRYAAYYSVFCFYIHMDNMQKMKELVEKYGQDFANILENLSEEYDLSLVLRFSYFWHVVQSQYLANEFVTTGKSRIMVQALEEAELANNKLNIRGTLQNYADVYALGLENGWEGRGKKDFYKTMDRIEKAIEQDENYAKYRCTYGRLLAQCGEYENAKIQLKKAIQMETLNDLNSTVRIYKYQYYYDRVDIEEKRKSMEKKQEELETAVNIELQKIENAQVKNIELMAFFSAVIALILSIQNMIGNWSNFYLTAGIILVMGGVIVLCFYMASLFLGVGNEAKIKAYNVRRLILTCAGSLGMILFGFLMARIH